MNGLPTITCQRRSRAVIRPRGGALRAWSFAPVTRFASKAFPTAKSMPRWITLKSTLRPRANDPALSFAEFDVVVDDDGEDHEDPHGEDAHSWDGFGNQAWQDHPSTAED